MNFPRLRARLDDARAFRELHPDAVDLDIDHLDFNRRNGGHENLWCSSASFSRGRCAEPSFRGRCRAAPASSERSRSRSVPPACIPAASAAAAVCERCASNSSRNFCNEALRRPGAGFAEGADRLAGDVVGDVFSMSRDRSPSPPPASMRSVIFFIHSEPSRHGVHWPHDS